MRGQFKARRGTSIAAAALSFALVAPLAQPVAFAQEEKPAAESAQNPEAPKPPAEAPASNAEAYEDAIHSPGDPENKGTISGSVKEVVEIYKGFGKVQDAGKALEGVKVYAQWYEGRRSEHASPVYYTTTNAQGNFSLNMAPYTDAEGVERRFSADASVGETVPQRDQKREKIRVWAELPEDLASKYRLVHQPAAGIFPPTAITPGTQGDGVWSDNKVSEVKIQFAQKTQLPQHLPQDKWVESQGSGLYGSYQGRAFWNLDVASGALRHETVSKYDGKDVPAAGLQVVGSYLSDEAVKAINEYVKKNFAGKTLRGNGWTVDDEQGLQKWIHEQVAADPEGWIAETVKTTTDANGEFSLYWKGLWGNSWESTPGTLTPPADKLHTLASRDEGTFINGNKSSKHVNMDWSFVQILDKDGNVLPDNVGTLYPWSLGNWDGPNAGRDAEVFGGGGVEINKSDDKYLRWNIALYPAPLKFDVLEKNTYDNWARVGETVETLTTGLPIGEGLEYFIEWTNDAGEVVKTCGPVMPDADTAIASCAVKVPEGVKHGDVFTARLYQGKDNSGALLAQDAFAVTTSYLAYEPEDAKVGVAKDSTPKFDDPDTAPVEEKLESAEFFLNEEKLPEGVTADQVEVDPKTGVVTFTPKAGQEGKSFDIPVKMVDTAIQVPVYDDNADPVVDAKGNQVTRPRTIFHASATFNVVDKDNASFEPKYEHTLVTPDKPAESSPTFTDKDGNKTEAPEGSKFAVPEDFTAPEGYTVDFDENFENNGKITVTVDKDKLNGDTVEEFDVPVTVTYPDGSTDETSAPFYLDTDGDGKPDVDGGIKDEDGKVVVEGDDDDDNDGVTDKEEKDKGSNPKDEKSVPASVDTEKKIVVEGQETDPFDTAKDVPEDGEVTVKDLPGGLTVDDKTGKVTGTPEKISDWGKEEEEREVTVTVTITDKDGKKVAEDQKVITVQRDTDGDGTPDVTDTDDDGDGVSDEDEKTAGTDPKDSNSVPSTIADIADKSGTVGEPIDSFKIEVDNVPTDGSVKVEGLPDGVTYNPETGEVSGTPEKAGKSTVTVTVLDKDRKPVTGADGKPVTKTFEFDVKDKAVTPTPDTQDKDKYQPEYEGGEGNPGGTAEVPAPKFKDDKGNETTPPEGTTFDKGEGAPEGVEIDKDGKITVKVPGDATPGDKITVPVKVTYPDESTETVDVTVNVVKPDPSVKEGDNTTVPADGGEHTVGTVENPNGDEKGKLVDKDGNEIPGSNVEIDKETGKVKVTVPEGTDPQDAKVIITDGTGKDTIGEIDVNIVDPESDAANNVPNYGDRKNVEAGETEKSDPFEGKTDVPVKKATGTESDGSEAWTFNTAPKTGVVEAKAPSYDDVKKKIEAELPKIDSSWDKFKEIFTPYVRPSVTVDFVYNDGSKNDATAGFDLVGKDGKSLLDPDGDFDKDGISNKDEIEKGSNPANGDEIPDTEKPTVNPVKPGDTTISGKDDTPNSTIKVTLPNGTVVETETDKDGNWKVDVPAGVELKHGDKITVTDKSGKSTDVTVTDTAAPTVNPIKPGDKTISGKGDRPNETIKVTLPNGKVVETETDKDGNWKVDVPAGVELKPGDKITVTDGAHTVEAKVGIDTGKCVASAVGFGLPLIALLPLGLASQIQIPVLSDVAAQVDAQLKTVNTRIQQQAGVFNPEMARQAEQINAQLRTVGADLGMVAAGIVLIAAGILAGTVIYDNCNPNGPKSSVKDLELKGSSGKTMKLSSKGTAAPKTTAKPKKEQ
ncbi:YPDG domain-containing protein [Corynebacterium sp. UMB2355A]|uniref:YPDG domain-containing protein n=1 Tax=Corynebacterium sp. UMB2355A TaxID=3081222 RepID=UPI0029FF3B58|nr:YPDG domain-containing protein [Corynebacterium sp. UMB2355A]WPJ93621.1 YPDG domain-containing protein [Corynebacterium sp. UMB2355A]